MKNEKSETALDYVRIFEVIKIIRENYAIFGCVSGNPGQLIQNWIQKFENFMT